MDAKVSPLPHSLLLTDYLVHGLDSSLLVLVTPTLTKERASRAHCIVITTARGTARSEAVRRDIYKHSKTIRLIVRKLQCQNLYNFLKVHYLQISLVDSKSDCSTVFTKTSVIVSAIFVKLGHIFIETQEKALTQNFHLHCNC